MKKPIGKLTAWCVILLSALLITSGVIMLSHVYDQYPAAILQNEDDHLLELARSVDRNIESYVSRFSEDLTYVTQRSGFLASEARWRLSGETDEMMFRLTENLSAQNEMTHAILALQDDQVLLSTDGCTDYYFPPKAGMRGEISLRPSIDCSGNVYLAFQREAGGGLSYAVLMDLNAFYQQVANDLTSQSGDAVVLMDAGGQTILHSRDGTAQTVSVRAIDQSADGYDAVRLMKEAHEKDEVTTLSYKTTDLHGKAYTARMTVMPYSASQNSIFTVIVTSNYDEVIVPLRLASVRLIAYGSMVVIGILLLLGMVILQSRRNEEHEAQLRTLLEKNAAIEKLNEQTRELAHHQRLETIGTLTSGIAHEFNNLLTPIMGYSLLTLEKLPPEGDELYDNLLEIYNASCKAKEVVSRLSTLSRKNDDTRQSLISPDALAERTVSVALPAKPEGVEVIMEPHCADACVLGSETQLSQMLLNLVLNAFQAMEARGGQLTISTNCQDDFVCFTVRDTGPGIALDVLPHVFTPFFTTKEAGRGTGLGLAIVQQVVEAHHGEISIDTGDGGTSVLVKLPGAPHAAQE